MNNNTKFESTEFTAYRVNFTIGKYEHCDYFASRAEAQALIDKHANGTIKRVRMRRHHTATGRGYIRVNESHTESYAGKWGKGFVRHHTSKESNRGNRHHLITYYVESK